MVGVSKAGQTLTCHGGTVGDHRAVYPCWVSGAVFEGGGVVTVRVAAGKSSIGKSVTTSAGGYEKWALVGPGRKGTEAACRFLYRLLVFKVADKLALAALSDGVEIKKRFQVAGAVEDGKEFSANGLNIQ